MLTFPFYVTHTTHHGTHTTALLPLSVVGLYDSSQASISSPHLFKRKVSQKYALEKGLVEDLFTLNAIDPVSFCDLSIVIHKSSW